MKSEMGSEVLELLQRYFGHESLRPGQQEVISRVLSGVNTLAILPTGGGKSLCYQLPALCMGGLSIVVSPLIALMRDQVQGLIQRGIPAARLDSTSSAGEEAGTISKIESGELKLLYLSPERVAEPTMTQLLRSCSISMVAIDEAHCVSEWGHSFRPSYITLPKLLRSLKPQVVLALTATASVQTARSIRHAFKILKRNQVQTSFLRSNLAYDVKVCPVDEKRRFLLEALQQEARTPAIVYATRRGDVEELSSFLNASDIAARAYHAGMSADARAAVQDGFVSGRFPVICATIAFGMGVDMPGIRAVIHYDPPKSPEGWIQESGRAGRDGKTSYCGLLLSGDDRAVLEGLVMARQPGRKAVEAILQNLFCQGKRAMVSRYDLSTLNDVPFELLDVLFARLVSAGWISPDGGSWKWCHVVPLRWDEAARARMLSGFPRKTQATLASLIESKQRVSLVELANHEVTTMNRLLGVLRELEAAGEVQLKLSHSLVHYRIKREPGHLDDLAGEVMSAFQEHAEHDLARIQAVFQMATSRRCITSSLIGYFGETLATPCGRCASCRGNKRSAILPVTPVEDISMDELESIQTLVGQKRAPLSSPERLARFLCGIHSPAMMRYRLYSHPDWGLLARLPYADVLACARAQL